MLVQTGELACVYVSVRNSVTRKEYRLGAATEAFASALVNTAAAFQVANDNDKQQEDKQQEDEQQEDEEL